MKKCLIIMICFLWILLLIIPADATMIKYQEDFESGIYTDTGLPAWVYGWLGNYTSLWPYRQRDNTGVLWVKDCERRWDQIIEIDPSFGLEIFSLSMDIASYVPVQYQVFDMSGNIILDSDIITAKNKLKKSGAYSVYSEAPIYSSFQDERIYSNYTVTSTNGISKLVFLHKGSESVLGNTLIDNIEVKTSSDDIPTPTPEPSTMLLLGSGLAGLAIHRKIIKKN